MSTKKNVLSKSIIKNDTHKSRLKFKAIQAFESGASVSAIARQVGKSRLTIYRWLHGAHRTLSVRKGVSRKGIDLHSANRVIELYILLKKPSMQKLAQALADLFAIRLHPATLRRFLIKRGLSTWRPSPFFDLVCQSRVSAGARENDGHAKSVEESVPR